MKITCLAVGLAVALGSAAGAQAQVYPSRPLNLIVPEYAFTADQMIRIG